MIKLVILMTFIMYISYFLKENDFIKSENNLDNNGFVILEKKDEIYNYLSNNYKFLNYKYSIKGCTLQTFHRDVTSSQYIFKTKYPIYTYIEYYNKGPVLSVCSGSHRTVPFLFQRAVTIYNNNSQIGILFNCDLIHAGALNDLGNKRYAVQYKIAHKDDIEKIKHLNNINKITDYDCKNNNFVKNYILRKLSLLFSYPINHIFTKYLQNNQNNFLNDILIKILGKKFYNN